MCTTGLPGVLVNPCEMCHVTRNKNANNDLSASE